MQRGEGPGGSHMAHVCIILDTMLRARGRRAGAAVDSASDARRSIAGVRTAPGTANAAALAALAAIMTSLRVTCIASKEFVVLEECPRS